METKINDSLSVAERRELLLLAAELRDVLENRLDDKELKCLSSTLRDSLRKPRQAHDDKGLAEAIMTLKTANAFAGMVDPDHNILIAILLHPLVKQKLMSADEVETIWGTDIAGLHRGLEEVARFSTRNSATNQENFRGLIISLAHDIRVIIIMIVRSLVLMRSINLHPDDAWVRNVAFEANCLYAQLAHRLGLYKIKGELEDLSLKYTNREIYTQIAHKLNATKRSRDAYIKAFIDPVKNELEKAGLKFEIKGRTKSISSIWNKMRKQKVDLPGIYDLFAIRVILDSEPAKEKSDCWLAYSILADMYTANPARMRDWISIPKSNGYESLHATVMGPDNKWVEVQFRTRRMDLVAEKGLAAHWRYKGGKADGTDQWMNNIRDILESADAGPMQLMRSMRINQEKEVFAFTPKGDLFRLSPGSTVLDFAFHIHSNVGCHCTGALVNGRHEKITYRVCNGDTVEIITSATQSPKQDWLQVVVSSRARNKIRQALNEAKTRQADLGRELLERRFKNRKLEVDETLLSKAIKKLGYRFSSDFFADVAEGTLDMNRVIALCTPVLAETEGAVPHVGAEEFRIRSGQEESKGDVLVIGDKNIKGLNYKMARCCAPVYGDEVFGFISSDGVVKIHRCDCPNARHIREKYPYRLISVKWSGEAGALMSVNIRVVGQDDIGIVTNITSIINKEKNTQLRSISINSLDGLFNGEMTIGIADRNALGSLLKKISTVKGVKQVIRI